MWNNLWPQCNLNSHTSIKYCVCVTKFRLSESYFSDRAMFVLQVEATDVNNNTNDTSQGIRIYMYSIAHRQTYNVMYFDWTICTPCWLRSQFRMYGMLHKLLWTIACSTAATVHCSNTWLISGNTLFVFIFRRVCVCVCVCVCAYFPESLIPSHVAA